MSIGIGSTRVELCSVATSASVCRVLRVSAPGALAGDDVRRLRETLRHLILALGGDDLHAALALGLGLARHRALHRVGQARHP